jgi:hypothetical protein
MREKALQQVKLGAPELIGDKYRKNRRRIWSTTSPEDNGRMTTG